MTSYAKPVNLHRVLFFAASAGIAAAFVGVATSEAKPNKQQTVVVEGQRIDPETQRIVRYGDLNLAFRPEQKVLMQRISTTARSLCYDLGHSGFDENWTCKREAIHSTDDQVAAAIDRAKLKMAGRRVGPAIAISMVVGAQ